jgi:ribonuclease HI
MGKEARTVVVHADASFESGSGEGGWSTAIIDGAATHSYYGVLRGCQDCSQAELVALAAGARLALQNLTWRPGDQLCLQSDCLHALNALIGVEKDLRDIDVVHVRGFRELVVRNRLRVSIQHVPGHSARMTEEEANKAGLDFKALAVNAWADAAAKAGRALTRLAATAAA